MIISGLRPIQFDYNLATTPPENTSPSVTIDSHVENRTHHHTFWFDDDYQVNVTKIKDAKTNEVLLTIEQNADSGKLKVTGRDGKQVLEENISDTIKKDFTVANHSKEAEAQDHATYRKKDQYDNTASFIITDKQTGLQTVLALKVAGQNDFNRMAQCNVRVYDSAQKIGQSLYAGPKFDKTTWGLISHGDNGKKQESLPAPLAESKLQRPDDEWL